METKKEYGGRSTITAKGQTTIPKFVRERLGLAYGDAIDFIVQPDGTAVLKPASVDVMSLAGLLKRKGRKARTVEQMDDAVRDAASQR